MVTPDKRLNRTYRIIECGRGPDNDKYLYEAKLIADLGYGHFRGLRLDINEAVNIYSCQLKRQK